MGIPIALAGVGVVTVRVVLRYSADARDALITAAGGAG
jgi:hypothetical protein